MIQEILLGLVFLASLYYVGRLLYKSFQGKSSCATGCGKCGVIDIQKIEAQMRKEGL